MSGQGKAKILLLDGHSLAFRAFYALPSDLRTSSGQQTNAVYGFTSMLLKALQDYKTKHVAVVFDKGRPVERTEVRPEYKAQRDAPPDEFREQLGLIREVLSTMGVPVFDMNGVEADDLIAVVARRLAKEGHEVLVVTADRDFFQLVSPGIKLMMNRRGISDTVVYDEAGVVQRYGFGPDRYLDYAALRGDPSDNIDGVKGVGEKTATKLVQEHGSLEEIFDNIEDAPPRVRKNLTEAAERLLENRDFFRFWNEEELGAKGPIPKTEVDDLRIADWDLPAIRKLFDSLEFKTLYERLTTELTTETPPDRGLEAKIREIEDSKELETLVEELESQNVVAFQTGGSSAREAPGWIALYQETNNGPSAHLVKASSQAFKTLAPLFASGRLATHGSKEALQSLQAAGIECGGFIMDTEIASYLLDPARGSYTLEELVDRHLGRQLKVESAPAARPGAQQELALDGEDEASDPPGLEAVAVGTLTPILEAEIRNRGVQDLFVNLELPLAKVLAKLEIAGIKIDSSYLEGMASDMSKELDSIEADIYKHAEEPFNINSPPQLRKILYEKLGLKPSKRTKTGYSTDASVLESLRDEHPIIESILRYRERSKLKSTYVDALPPLVDLRTGRLHCSFNQTVASTGRLSSDSPNLQNIPIRTEEGRQIRRAFIPEDGYLLMIADYSQIELRVLAHLSEDPELTGAFDRGEDIHVKSIAKALGIEEKEVNSELRSIGKMVSYGVTYGMGPFGLSQRLRIPVDQARSYIDGFFATYPQIRTYLDSVVEKATGDGYTTTLLGRRRYLPELTSRNPRVRSLGERMALNAPIQGSAADVMKLAMIRADEALGKGDARAVLTVHDELVFEVPHTETEQVVEAVRQAMESVVELRVPLKVDISWGKNWADAKS